MATVMEMPKLSDTMSEGSVARWLKKEGEKVSAGIPIIEIETDKATMEYESPAGGILLKILVGDGQKCPLQAPIAVIGKDGEKWEEALEKYNAKKGGASSAPASSAPKKEEKAATPAQSSASKTATSSQTNDLVKASPLAKKIAEDKGIDLKSIQGSGPNGRIVQRDLAQVSSSSGVATAGAPSFAFGAAEVEKIPHTNMRKTIAKRLTESLQTSPHFYLTVSINMTNLLAWRKDVIAKLSEAEKFSVNDLVIFLTSRALKRHPEINSSWQDDHVARYRDVHMSVAVALPNGLMTPVVRHADKLTVVQIAQETKRLVKLAKDGKLQPNDYAGGTFSVSNLGMAGIESFTAIINPPQAAILAVGATVPTPVVLANGSVGVEQRMKVTLSCDHRVIDGALGAEFLKTLRQFFEDPVSALFLG
ncbi:pyruvate dehydrogenase complex dihydrolipoamide acetyltransferase [Pigmentibacter sp. JX0631]|uniref:pyruvate dehydrogenase complex dihydrolipoamide acetyltransferase n=1 Tax=Pigmentibacter sp. JX0631 TaxID=2976982 RepID=UPI002469892D|nr:pyruvate dehydrogenase complex dihydrolipoamide acetyltransferase [Pigmentibacter sp. JX0631]WGL59311.1 pyruvate dehydrogenase complex dihydrolipoamide acetyltransferase [Pigmentibacter sp. JX0631]